MSELDLEELYNYVMNKKDLKFSLGQILEAWGDSYGENIVLEYPGFIQKLIENESN